MEIKKLESAETFLSRTVSYRLLIKDREIGIKKRWFSEFDGITSEWEWDIEEKEDKEFVGKLEDEEKDELDDFISELE